MQIVSSSGSYPDLLSSLQQWFLELVLLNVLHEEGCEVIGHTACQNVALGGRRAPVAHIHLEQIRDIQGKQVQNEVPGSFLFHVARAHGLDEIQKKLVVV